MSIIIEAVKQYSEVCHSRDWERDGNKGTSHSQELFAHLGGPFPERIKVSIEGPDKLLPLGKYQLTANSFKVGQYGDLEINRYELVKTLESLASK